MARSKKYQTRMEEASALLSSKNNLPSKKDSNLPTYEELMFGRTVEQRATREQDTEEASGWDIAIPNDVENVGTEMFTAPTTNPSRPRALTIGYSPTTQKLIVVFRDNTWWQYNNVPSDTWVGLRNSASTGKFLRSEGLDNWPDMGPADLDSLSESVKARISDSALNANNIQNSNTAINEALSNNTSMPSFNDEEMRKDYL